MTGTAVLRIDALKTLRMAVVLHNQGKLRAATARPDIPPSRPAEPDIIGTHEPVKLARLHEFESDEAGARQAVLKDRGRRAETHKGGRPPNECMMFVLAGPPPYGSDEQWSDERELAWAKASDAWARTVAGPESVVAVSCLHRDETSPHLHFSFVPLADGRISWKERQTKLHGAELPVQQRYRRLQDSYHERVGRQYGLSRGVVGSTARHRKPDRQEASERARELADKQVREANQKLVDLRTEEHTVQLSLATLRADGVQELEAASKRKTDAAAADKAAKALSDAGARTLLGKPAARGRALYEELADALETARAETARADAAEEKHAALKSAYDMLAEGRDRMYRELDSAYTYVVGRLSEYVDRWMGGSASAPAVRYVAGEMMEWAETKFSNDWVSPIGAREQAKREARAVREGAHDAPAVHQGRDTGSGL